MTPVFHGSVFLPTYASSAGTRSSDRTVASPGLRFSRADEVIAGARRRFAETIAV
jgi:hypothetical protein